MITARLLRASTPVAPTTAAIAPNAPTGATHITMASTLKMTFCRCPMPRRTGRPHGLQGEAGEQGDDQRLQHLAARDRGEERRRDHALQEVPEADGPLG